MGSKLLEDDHVRSFHDKAGSETFLGNKKRSFTLNIKKKKLFNGYSFPSLCLNNSEPFTRNQCNIFAM